MSQYSTETQPNAMGGKAENGPETISDPEVKKYTGNKEITSWCYLFIHHAKVETVSKKLQTEQYRIFVHKSIVYKRGNKRIKKEEQATISGLVFIQGDANRIQKFLKENFFNLYLVKDCSTGEIAAIPDSVMQPFMRVSEVTPTRIRFMPHSFDYYSVGNPLVRITSGILSGLEGYRIRISRDKCLVTSIGGMTVAIGGIYKESFENLDEYVRLRRKQLEKIRQSSYVTFTPLQKEIDGCFFTPQNQLDIMGMAENLTPWVTRMKSDMVKKNFDEAVEIAFFLLEETGSYFRSIYYDSHIGDMKDMMIICEKADQILVSVINCMDISVDLKEIVETGRESLAIRYPFLPIEL